MKRHFCSVLLLFYMVGNVLAQGWTVDPSPNPRTNNRLNAVAAISSTDAWAVGYYFNYATTPDQTLALHWNGTAWSQVASPNISNNGYLNGIAAVASNDVWAVGHYYPGTAGQTLIEHWNGTSWSVVASQNRVGYNELKAVTAISADNVWAVGYSGGDHATLVEHWDGTQWSIVPSPPVSFSVDYILTGVSAVSANDIWAVGYVDIQSGTRRSLIEHWDGTQWSIVPSPNPGAYVTTLSGVTAVSVNDVWAAGWYSDDGGATYLTLFEHWNGSTWSVVPSPNPSSYQHNLHSIFAGSANDIWSVGNYAAATFANNQTLIEHWDGTSWSIVSGVDPGASSNSLYAVATLPSGEAWAMGRSYQLFNSNQPWQTLIEHHRNPTSVHESGIPVVMRLDQNYPNPFNPTTTIRFEIPQLGFVSLKVFDVLGREVATLVNEEKFPGNYSVRWDATNVGSGTYFARLESNGKHQMTKMLLLK